MKERKGRRWTRGEEKKGNEERDITERKCELRKEEKWKKCVTESTH